MRQQVPALKLLEGFIGIFEKKFAPIFRPGRCRFLPGGMRHEVSGSKEFRFHQRCCSIIRAAIPGGTPPVYAGGMRHEVAVSKDFQFR
jgi:hypothetical protein